jgi:hypothetical protein
VAPRSWLVVVIGMVVASGAGGLGVSTVEGNEARLIGAERLAEPCDRDLPRP